MISKQDPVGNFKPRSSDNMFSNFFGANEQLQKEISSLTEALDAAKGELIDKSEVIYQLQNEQASNRKLLLELQNLVSEQERKGVLKSYANINANSPVDIKLVNTLSSIFNHHQVQEDGYKAASMKNFQLEKQLSSAQEELMSIKRETLKFTKNRKQKEQELREALEKNFALQEDLRKIQEELSSYKVRKFEKPFNHKFWYENQMGIERNARLYATLGRKNSRKSICLAFPSSSLQELQEAVNNSSSVDASGDFIAVKQKKEVAKNTEVSIYFQVDISLASRVLRNHSGSATDILSMIELTWKHKD